MKLNYKSWVNLSILLYLGNHIIFFSFQQRKAGPFDFNTNTIYFFFANNEINFITLYPFALKESQLNIFTW